MLLVCAGIAIGCSAGPTDLHDAELDATELDAGVDSGGATDGGASDAGFSDAARDATVDASDAGIDAMVTCSVDPLPIPSVPPCTDEQAACFRACPDRACRTDCMMAMLSECWYCVLSAEWNCSMDWCPSELSEWHCCLESRCPPSGPCTACDPEREAIQSCNEAVFVPHCRAALEVCFP